jgi:DNA repair protein RecO
LEPFVLADFHIAKSKTIDIMAGSNTLASNGRLRHSLHHTAIANYFSEVVDRCVDEREHDVAVYEHVRDFITWLGENSPNTLVMYSALLQFFGLLGYRVELYTCHNCLKPITQEGTKLDLKLWNVECANCSSPDQTIALSADTIKALRFATEHPYKTVQALQVSKQAWNQIDQAMRSLIRYHLARIPTSESVFVALMHEQSTESVSPRI